MRDLQWFSDNVMRLELELYESTYQWLRCPGVGQASGSGHGAGPWP